MCIQSQSGDACATHPINGINHMKLLTIAFLLVLSIGAVQAQTATANPPAAPAPPPSAVPLVAGYLVVFPQVPLLTIHFDATSEDIAKAIVVPHAGTSFNHDGKAFSGYVRSTSSESYNDNVVDYAQFDKNVTEYEKNVKAGKWHGFVNGE